MNIANKCQFEAPAVRDVTLVVNCYLWCGVENVRANGFFYALGKSVAM